MNNPPGPRPPPPPMADLRSFTRWRRSDSLACSPSARVVVQLPSSNPFTGYLAHAPPSRHDSPLGSELASSRAMCEMQLCCRCALLGRVRGAARVGPVTHPDLAIGARLQTLPVLRCGVRVLPRLFSPPGRGAGRGWPRRSFRAAVSALVSTAASISSRRGRASGALVAACAHDFGT